MNRWRLAEKLSRRVAIGATLLWAVFSLWAVRFNPPARNAERAFDITLPPSAVVLAQWEDPLGGLFSTGSKGGTLYLDKRDAPAFVAEVKRKLYRRPAPGAEYFGFPDKPWRDGPSGSRIYLCEYKATDALLITVSPERAGLVLVDLATSITE